MDHNGQEQMQNLAKIKQKKKKQKKYKLADESNPADSKNSLDKSGIDSSFAERHMERNTDLHGPKTKKKKKKKHKSEADVKSLDVPGTTQNTQSSLGKDTGNIMEEIKAEHKQTEWPYVADWDLEEQGNVQPGQKQQNSSKNLKFEYTDAQWPSKKKHKPKKHKNQTEAGYSPVSVYKQKSPEKQHTSKKLEKQSMQDVKDTILINNDNGSEDASTSYLLKNDESEKKRMDRKKKNPIAVAMLKSPEVKKPRYGHLESHNNGIETQSKGEGGNTNTRPDVDETAFDKLQNCEDEQHQQSEPCLEEEDAQKLPKKKHKRKKNKHRIEVRKSLVDGLMTADITKSVSEHEANDVSLANKHQRMPIFFNKQPKLKADNDKIGNISSAAGSNISAAVLKPGGNSKKDPFVGSFKSNNQGTTSDSELSTSSISTSDNIGHNNLPLNTTNTTKSADSLKDRKGHNVSPTKKQHKSEKHGVDREQKNKDLEDTAAINQEQDSDTEDASSSVLHTDGNEKRRKRKNSKHVFKSPKIKKSRHGQHKRHDNGIETHSKGMSGNKNVGRLDVVKTEQQQQQQAEGDDGDISPTTEDEQMSLQLEAGEESEEEERNSEKKYWVTRKKKENQDDVKTGRWSGTEDKMLKENMENFCKEHMIDNTRKLLFPMEYDDRDELKQLIREFDLYRELGEGLPRTRDSVYLRARKLFDTQHYKGRWTDEDLKELRRLHAIHGNKWSVIGQAMERSSRSVNDKYRQLKESRVTGPWTDREKAQLKKAVEEVVEFDASDNAYYNIPWTKVAEKVPTRNFTQCRKEWLVHTQQCSEKMQKRAWTRDDSVELIERIYASEYNDESEIDWLELHAQHFPSEASPQSLKARWTNLKQRYIVQYALKSFEEIVDKLHEYIIPRLTKQSHRPPGGWWKSMPSTASARKRIKKKSAQSASS